MAKPETKKTRREELRMQRRRRQMMVRLIVVGAILGLVALIVVFGVIPAVNAQRAAASLRATQAVLPVNVPTSIAHPQANGKAMGDPNAPVKIDIYEDFQCPNCRDYSQDIEPQIIEQYIATGQVYYEYHHMPFLDDGAGKESDQAANASMCAAEQGKFWEYKEIVFANWNGENEGAYSDLRLVTFAEKLGLDMDKFNACFEDNPYKGIIDNDLASGYSQGINSVPTVLVNGERVPAALQNIQQAVDAALTQQ